jgi:hypothetical protein
VSSNIVAGADSTLGPRAGLRAERFQSRAAARVIVGCVPETLTSLIGIQSDPPSFTSPRPISFPWGICLPQFSSVPLRAMPSPIRLLSRGQGIGCTPTNLVRAGEAAGTICAMQSPQRLK